MATVEVFDPPMCCSTGVCGPSVDPALAAFAADLGWLGEQGATVERHNLSHEPGAFAANDVVRSLLAEQGDKALPAVVVEGTLRSWGRYPSRDELVTWAQGQSSPGALDAATAELVALGAAVGANCEPCFKYHYDQARRLGVRAPAMVEAVRVAQAVKDTPARSMLELAAKLLGAEPGALRAGIPGAVDVPAAGAASESAETAGGCCGGEPDAGEVSLAGVGAAVEAASGCCG
jgi:AhpD family alkylhydroperoxidase